MKYHYDVQADAISIRFSEKPSFDSEEVKDDVIFDYDENDRIVGLEILNVSKRIADDFSVASFVWVEMPENQRFANIFKKNYKADSSENNNYEEAVV